MSDPSGFDVLEQLSSLYYGKQMYFMQDNGIIYSRYSCKYLRTLQDAVNEFGKLLDYDEEATT